MEGVESELVTVTHYMYQGSGTRTVWSRFPESLKHQPSQHTIQTDDCHKSNQGTTLLGTLRSPQWCERFSEGIQTSPVNLLPECNSKIWTHSTWSTIVTLVNRSKHGRTSRNSLININIKIFLRKFSFARLSFFFYLYDLNFLFNNLIWCPLNINFNWLSTAA